MAKSQFITRDSQAKQYSSRHAIDLKRLFCEVWLTEQERRKSRVVWNGRTNVHGLAGV